MPLHVRFDKFGGHPAEPRLRRGDPAEPSTCPRCGVAGAELVGRDRELLVRLQDHGLARESDARILEVLRPRVEQLRGRPGGAPPELLLEEIAPASLRSIDLRAAAKLRREPVTAATFLRGRVAGEVAWWPGLRRAGVAIAGTVAWLEASGAREAALSAIAARRTL